MKQVLKKISILMISFCISIISMATNCYCHNAWGCGPGGYGQQYCTTDSYSWSQSGNGPCLMENNTGIIIHSQYSFWFGAVNQQGEAEEIDVYEAASGGACTTGTSF